MFPWHRSATSVSVIGATLVRVSPPAGSHGSGRELHVTPSTVTSSTSGAAGAPRSIRAAGTPRYATVPCTARTTVLKADRAGSVRGTCVHDPLPGVVRHSVIG